MRKNMFGLVFALALVTASGLGLAEHASVARLVFFNATPGSKASIEEAIKKQMALRREQHDPWRWLTWEYVSGEVPRYCVATFGHDWADFDRPHANGEAEAALDVAASSPSPPVVQYFEHLEEVSEFGMQSNTPTLAEISTFQLHYGKTAQFYATVREFHDALSRAGAENRYEWFELRSGGDAPQFMLLVPRANWGGFDPSNAPLFSLLEKTLGKRKTAKLFEQLSSAVKSHQCVAVRLRPDLSLLSPRSSPEQ